MENFNEPNMTESKLETEVQIKIEPESDAWMRNGPESDIDIKNELDAALETEVEFGVGTKLNNILVRILGGLVSS